MVASDKLYGIDHFAIVCPTLQNTGGIIIEFEMNARELQTIQCVDLPIT
jgi:hypothetical protein